MARFAILSLVLLLPTAAPAADGDARTFAQDILTKGAALFDTRNAAAMATTYTEDAEGSLVIKSLVTRKYDAQVTRGRAAIEEDYQNLFKDRPAGTTSRNDVEYARFVGTDLLIIHGKFTPDISQAVSVPFVQVRTKRGEQWLIMRLQVFVVLDEGG